MSTKELALAFTTTTVLAGGIFAPLAWAEGSQTVTYRGASVGAESYKWKDHNYDGTGTWIQISSCRVSSDINTIGLRLRQTRTLMPDRNAGDWNYTSCYTRENHNFGRQPAGEYYHQINNVGKSIYSSFNGTITVTF